MPSRPSNQPAHCQRAETKPVCSAAASVQGLTDKRRETGHGRASVKDFQKGPRVTLDWQRQGGRDLQHTLTYVALTGLELQRSSCLCLLNTGIKACASIVTSQRLREDEHAGKMMDADGDETMGSSTSRGPGVAGEGLGGSRPSL